MGKRGRPRKVPTIVKGDEVSDLEPSDAAHVLAVKIPRPISDVPTKNRKSPHLSPSGKPSSAEPPTIREPSLAIPKEWRNVPFDDLREEGWKPRRLLRRDGREYMSLRVSWTGEDGKTQSRDRAFGRYDPDKYAILLELMNPEIERNEEDFSTDDAPTNDSEQSPKKEQYDHGTIEASEIAPDRLPNAQRYAIRSAKILQSGVGKNISIPDKFYYDTDILEFYEYFKSRWRFSGTIVEWMHECTRNYLIEHHWKVGVIFERRS